MSSPWAAVLAGLGQAASGLGRDINERRAMEEQQKRIDEQNRRVAEQQALENLLRIRAAGGSIVPQGTDPQQALARLTTGNTLRSIGATSGGAFGIPSFSVPDLDGTPELASAGGMNILFDPSKSPEAIANRRQSLAQIAADRRAKQAQDAASSLEDRREKAAAAAADTNFEHQKYLQEHAYHAPPQTSYSPVTLGGENGTPAVVVPFDTKTGTTGKPIGNAKPTGGASTGAASIQKAIAENRATLGAISQAIDAVKAHPQSFGIKRDVPLVGDRLNQVMDPDGVAARAMVSSIGSKVVHDRSGANVTARESKLTAPFVPDIGGQSAAIITKLQQMATMVQRETDELERTRGGSQPAGRSLSPEDAEHAKRDPQFAAWLRSKGYEVP